MAIETAIFAGGCFWCMVQPFDSLDGIEKVRSGYTGGHVENPTYEQVSSHTTGHTANWLITFGAGSKAVGGISKRGTTSQ